MIKNIIDTLKKIINVYWFEFWAVLGALILAFYVVTSFTTDNYSLAAAPTAETAAAETVELAEISSADAVTTEYLYELNADKNGFDYMIIDDLKRKYDNAEILDIINSDNFNYEYQIYFNEGDYCKDYKEYYMEQFIKDNPYHANYKKLSIAAADDGVINEIYDIYICY